MALNIVIKVLLLTLTMAVLCDQGQGQGIGSYVVVSTNSFSAFANLDLAAGVSKYLQHETKRLEVIKNAKGYEKEVPILKTRLQKLQQLSEREKSRTAETATLRQSLKDFHPTSALRAVSHFLDSWTDEIKNDTLYGFRFPEFLSNDDVTRLPSVGDLGHLSIALTDIQIVYNLSIPDVYHGKVMGQKGTALKPKDAFAIGKTSYEFAQFREAASWLQMALDNTPEAEMTAKNVKNASYPVATAMALQGILKYGLGDQSKGLELLEKASDLAPDTDWILRDYLTHRFGRDVQPLVQLDLSDFKRHWFRLCANASSAVVVPLKWYHVCRYRRSSVVPYRVYREEILSRSPFLSLVHHFISPKEAKTAVNVSSDKLGQPAVEGAVSELYNVQGAKLTSKVPVAKLISDRITDLTGMSTQEGPGPLSAEPLQVLNYGIAGAFHPHYDINRRYEPNNILNWSGHRLASVLIYLSEVKAGGATVFPHLNITVTPKVGQALLWFNTSPSGDAERNIVHAGCPVAVGAKWVANKGLWSFDNELRHPCGRKVTSSHLAVDKMAPRFTRS